MPLQHALSSAGIAYRIIGAHSLWERVEVLDALAYVTLVSNPYDTVAFRRAVSAPSDRRQFAKAKHPALSRGVGDVTAQAVIRYARSAEIDLLEACATAGERRAADHGLVASPVARASLALFGEQLRGVRREHLRTGQLAKAVIATLTIADGPVDCYDDLLKHTDDAAVAADCARVKEDLRSLCRAAHTYEQRHGRRGSLVGFLEQTRVEPAAALTAEQDERLTISTIHGAKGTEARVVFVIGCEEGLLPIAYALESARRAARRGGTPAVLRRRDTGQGPRDVHDERRAPRATDQGAVAISRRGRDVISPGDVTRNARSVRGRPARKPGVRSPPHQRRRAEGAQQSRHGRARRNGTAVVASGERVALHRSFSSLSAECL